MSAVTFERVDPAAVIAPELRTELLSTWVAVTDAGGAVGFVAPADAAAHAVLLDGIIRRVGAGEDALGVLRDGPGGPAIGMGVLVSSDSPLRRHWRTIARVMVHPGWQGTGAGRTLLDGLHGLAATLGLEQVQVTVRGGTGVEGFYLRHGYEIVGAHPRAIRVAPGEDRDEIMLVRPITA